MNETIVRIRSGEGKVKEGRIFWDIKKKSKKKTPRISLRNFIGDVFSVHIVCVENIPRFVWFVKWG